MSLTPAELKRFAADLAATPERWRHATDVRVFEQIWDDEEVNAWVICWSEDQDTGFHDHDESSAAIAVIEGQVREDRLRVDQAPISRTFGPRSSPFRRWRSTACCTPATLRR
jgi:Cysteine dioxygenase type I